MQFVEYLEWLDEVPRPARAERESGTPDAYLPVLNRLGVSSAQCEEPAPMTNRRFS